MVIDCDCTSWTKNNNNNFWTDKKEQHVSVKSKRIRKRSSDWIKHNKIKYSIHSCLKKIAKGLPSILPNSDKSLERV